MLLAWVSLYIQRGQLEQAARVLGALDEFYQQSAGALVPSERADHDADLAAARTQLGEAVFAQAWQAGQAMTIEQILEFVRLNP
ncbi:MAG: hypothetical protein HY835_11880 [Anaerolineae bacterium]|nr:hypothetical protein [Anaerolineae bacterium]